MQVIVTSRAVISVRRHCRESFLEKFFMIFPPSEYIPVRFYSESDQSPVQHEVFCAEKKCGRGLNY